MRDFDSIAIGLQANLTSRGCLDKDVRPPVCFSVASMSTA